MSIEKTKLKQELKEFWNEYGKAIKAGTTCLAIGLFIGFVKGVCTSDKMHSDTFNKLIEKIPYEPDYNDLFMYVYEHMDELKPFIEAELEYIATELE